MLVHRLEQLRAGQAQGAHLHLTAMARHPLGMGQALFLHPPLHQRHADFDPRRRQPRMHCVGAKMRR